MIATNAGNRMEDCLAKKDFLSGPKESQMAMTLTALRHDHPMISIDAASQHLMRDHKLPLNSLTHLESIIPSPPPDHFRSDFEAKRSCLPYGYYYDTEDMIELEDSLFSKSQGMDMMMEDWVMDDLSSAAIDEDYYYMRERRHLKPGFKHTKDTGPTLAQLNLTDNLDLEELLSSSPTFMTTVPGKRKTPPDHQQKENPKQHPSERAVIRTGDHVPAFPTKTHDSPSVRVESVATPNDTSSQSDSCCQRRPQQMTAHISISDPKACIPEHKHLPAKSPSRSILAPGTTAVSQKSTCDQESVVHVTSKPHDSPVGETESDESTGAKDVVISPRITSTRDGEKSNNSPFKSQQSPRARNSSMCTEGSVSSHDEGFASQVEEDSDEDEEVEDSDDESFYGDYDAKDLLGASTSDDQNNRWALNMGRSRKGGQQRFFWQYNVQSKGPKGSRIPSVASVSASSDPHVLPEAKDPVFSPECRVEGVKHAGKARRGDGNDLTPNPKKLLMIGLELKKLSRTINDLTPVSDVPVSARNKTRKEKNKLASRACRLKKKAQHEANKIKLFGLQQEHRKTMQILKDIRKLVQQNFESRTRGPKARYSTCIEQAVGQQGDFTLVAGRTSEFVNSVSNRHVIVITSF